MENNKSIHHLEEEYGIKENQQYSVTFKLEDTKFTTKVKGVVLNFCSGQLVLKSDKGLYIIHPRNIVEMMPIN